MANPAIERREAHAAITVDTSGHALRFRDDAARDWTLVGADEPLPETGAVIVPLDRLDEAESAGLTPGVRLMPEDDARTLAGHTHRLALIDIVFPKFRDGRGFSSARILRDDLGYAGELRAVGDVLADQLFFMRRCGIDSVVLNPCVRPETAEAALERYQFVYQRASDQRQPVWRQRRS